MLHSGHHLLLQSHYQRIFKAQVNFKIVIVTWKCLNQDLKKAVIIHQKTIKKKPDALEYSNTFREKAVLIVLCNRFFG